MTSLGKAVSGIREGFVVCKKPPGTSERMPGGFVTSSKNLRFKEMFLSAQKFKR